MITNHYKLKVALLVLAAFIAITPAFSLNAPKKKPNKTNTNVNTFENPDFAFPETVIKNAEKELKSSPNDTETIQAMIQLVIAGNSRDRYDASSLANKIDSMAQVKGGAVAAVLYSVEAQLIQEVYQNSYLDRNFNLPLTEPFPSNMNEWSSDMFFSRILQLCKKSLEQEHLLKSEPIEAWKGILSNFQSDQLNLCPNLYIFLASRALYILPFEEGGNDKVIPFFDSSSKKKSITELISDYRNEIIDKLESYARQQKLPLLLANAMIFNEYKVSSKYKFFTSLLDAYDSMKDSPDSFVFLILADDYLSDEKSTEENKCEAKERYRNALDEYLVRFPNSKHINNIKNCQTQLASFTISIDGAEQQRSDEPVKFSVSGLPNNTKYYLKLFSLAQSIPSNLSLNNILESSKYSEVVKVKEIIGSGTDCKSDTLEVNFGLLPYGTYAITLASQGNNDRRGLIDTYNALKFCVSDLGFITQVDINTTEGDGIYVLDNKNGRPLKDISVKIIPYLGYEKKQSVKLTSDAKGFVAIPPSEMDIYSRDSFVIENGKDKLEGDIYLTKYSSDSKAACVNIYTDLGLYKPGETLRYSLVAYEYGKNISSVFAEDSVQIVFSNSSGVEIGTNNLVTDKYGRASGEFTIPLNGMNGEFTLIAYRDDDPIGYQSVKVADYVAPKFFVDVKTTDSKYNLGDKIKIEGAVSTYSGMPVSDAKVNLTIKYFEDYWYRRYNAFANYSTELTTNLDGKFSIELPTDHLDQFYKKGFFTVEAEATAPSGETQASEVARFCIGNNKEIQIESGKEILVSDKELTLKATVSNSDGTNEKCLLNYKLTEKKSNKIISEGSFETPNLTINSDKIPSGLYLWEVMLPGTEEKQSSEILIYRFDDTTPPTESILWTPKTNYSSPQNVKSVDVKIGSSFDDQYILYVLSGKNGLIESSWLNVSNKIVSVNIPVNQNDEVLFADFYAMRNGKISSKKILIQTTKYTDQLEPEIVTFRDKIAAGGQETWKIRYSLGDKKAMFIPVMATMTDKSLNSITSFNWNKLNRFAYSNYMNISGLRISNDQSYWTIEDKLLQVPKEVWFPTLNTYGKSLYSYNQIMLLRASKRSSAMTMKSAPTMEEDGLFMIESASVAYAAGAVNDVAIAEEESEDASDAGIVEEDELNSPEEYRESECPVAFFMPNLLTNDDGVAEIAFTAPDFNTTWVLQMLAYDPNNLKSNVNKLETVASKKVMVQSQLPRFLRTGDDAVLAFTAFNNSGEEASISLSVEVLDPLTNEIISAKSFNPRKTKDTESFVETISFTAPSNMESIKVKVIAKLGNYSDGEQALIGILPSSTPVTESIPFYLAPNATEYTLQYLKGGEGSQIMFSYCDNPVWYCVTALPDMTFPKDASILSSVRHLYGNAIATGLINQYPQIGEAIKLWNETNDNILISPLQKEEALKITSINDTPWVLNAQSETLRMSQLVRLLDKEKCSSAIEEAIKDLADNQNADGGWSWCKDMKTSTFITARVLLYMSMLRQMGYLPASGKINSMINKAVKYCDKELYAEYIRNKRKFSTSQMLNYLYVRSGFPELTMSADFTSLKNKALKAIEDEWRNFSIYDASVAAIVLNRYNNSKIALLILESLRQKALTNPERGMWYANLNSSWNGRNKIITTAQVLEAYTEINPKAPQIDQLRQWLLIQRQTEDWGTSEEIAEVVHAILSSGTDWTSDYAPANIQINGKEIEKTQLEALTGSFSAALDNNGGVINIFKSEGHPAWGGILNRRILPIEEVKPYSESDISISKRMLRIVENESGISSEEIKEGETLHLGDKVRVQLMITSKRDMDYVCIIDGRSACLSPIQQLSGYVWNSGAGYYRDVQNDVTNLFYDFMPKGTTFAEYDCYVTQEGTYSLGISQIQCLYAPLQTAHSGGSTLTVKK